MTSMLDLIAARTALDGGRREEARKLLMGVVRNDMGNGEAWHLLSLAVDDPAQKADCERRAAAAGYVAPGAAAAPPAPERPVSPVTPALEPLAAPLPPPTAAIGPTMALKPLAPAPTPPMPVPTIDLWPCPRCGESNPRTSQFCARCGLNFAAPPPSPPMMQPPAMYPPQGYPPPAYPPPAYPPPAYPPPMAYPPQMMYGPAPQKRSFMPFILLGFVLVCGCFSLLNRVGSGSRTPPPLTFQESRNTPVTASSNSPGLALRSKYQAAGYSLPARPISNLNKPLVAYDGKHPNGTEVEILANREDGRIDNVLILSKITGSRSLSKAQDQVISAVKIALPNWKDAEAWIEDHAETPNSKTNVGDVQVEVDYNEDFNEFAVVLRYPYGRE